ncbi:hypothetical protein J0A67_05285 [Algoriphagus aestuariicola]|uniref:Cyclophilin-like domain-containing protein n=1 Tax=Algoriphagus aestuariicola TaxID=1852016 RepID=A0ABS3BLT2_9BACT|nr:cyclophilin-like fold protein [Algoriphagus aestuariicola]MBN7800263.1 hypothetical protein [Algoriphagus aestuariicola]
MKRPSYLIIILISLISLPLFAGCNEDTIPMTDRTDVQNPSDADTISTQIKIIIGQETFTATLIDNKSVHAFLDLLPLTITMSELNRNEKFFDFADSLPTDASRPEAIKTGDLMLYGSRTLVLFYKSFSTSYSYTKLGSIDDPSGLETALGSSNVLVTFELE